MHIKRKYRVLSGLLVLSLALLAGLAFHTWKLHQQVDELNATPGALWQDSDWSGALASPFAQPDWGLSQSPFTSLQQMHERMQAWMNGWAVQDPLISPFASSPLVADVLTGFSMSAPEIMIDETGNDYVISISVPEGQEVELNTSLEGDVFSVSGSVKNATESQQGNRYSQQRSHSRFSRQFVLAEPVDKQAMTIEQGEGEVVVRIPKL